MNMDLSTVVAFAALILSILSPFASSIISGIFRLKEKEKDIRAEAERKQQEFYDQHRAEVIESYIRAAGKACKAGSPTNLGDFGASMGEVYLYVDESQWPLLDTISRKLDRNCFMEPSDEFTALCKYLSHNNVREKYKVQPYSADKSDPN